MKTKICDLLQSPYLAFDVLSIECLFHRNESNHSLRGDDAELFELLKNWIGIKVIYYNIDLTTVAIMMLSYSLKILYACLSGRAQHKA
ncbi:hypothetical protein D1920_05050 [Rhodopseudomonas palustris]|nr:hypothetical protein D1920_05050 [Rhodopseudomonas palustris]